MMYPQESLEYDDSFWDDCWGDYFAADTEEVVLNFRSTNASVRRYRDERYKRKVSNVIRRQYHIFCPYGNNREKRYTLWKAIKSVGWRGHCRRGWYDRAFLKKLQNSRVRYMKGTVPKGNSYRKINTRHAAAGLEE